MGVGAQRSISIESGRDGVKPARAHAGEPNGPCRALTFRR
jgi:hypothetical protein